MLRNLVWTSAAYELLEHVSLIENDSGIVAESVCSGVVDGQPVRALFRIRCDTSWSTRELSVEIAERPGIVLLSDGQGNWSDESGSRLPGFAGCIDVDISTSAFTNTLPIRRLGLGIGESAEIGVLYCAVPAMRMSAARQRYTRLASDRYRFEGLASGFSAEITVDDEGLVVDYPRLFRRLPVGPG